jgi:hypothetical protein
MFARNIGQKPHKSSNFASPGECLISTLVGLNMGQRQI